MHWLAISHHYIICDIQNIINITQTGETNVVTLDQPLDISNADINAQDYVWILQTTAVNPAKVYYTHQNEFNEFITEYLNGQSAYVEDVDLYGYTPKLFRVLNIKELEHNQYEVTALQYAPNKYDLIEKNLQSDIDVIPVVASNLNPVTNLNIVRSNSGAATTMNFTWVDAINFNNATMTYVIQYIYNGVTYNVLTKNNYYTISGLTNPSASIAFTVYPSYDNQTSIAPNSDIVVSITATVGVSEMSALSITNLEIQGQGNNTEYTTKDLDIQWSFSNPAYLNYVDHFECYMGKLDGSQNMIAFNDPQILPPTFASGTNIYKATLTYDQNYNSATVTGDVAPHRAINVLVKAISIYDNDLTVSSNYRVFGSESMIATNSAPNSLTLNSGVSLTTASQSFTVDLDQSLLPDDYAGFMLYYSTGSFNPLSSINATTYLPSTSSVHLLDVPVANGASVTVNYAAGKPFYGCVVPYDEFGKYGLNLPTSIFSGIVDYGITEGVAPAAVNGFVITPTLETNSVYEQLPFAKMQWNASTESGIDGYDIRLFATGLNTRYYHTPVSQTNLFVEVEPNVNYTGIIRAINNQGLTSNPVSGLFTSLSKTSAAGGGTPIGYIGFFSSNTLTYPSGTEFMTCNGQILSTGVYSDLFNIIGFSYGSVGGTGFRIPSGLRWNSDIPGVIRVK